MKKTVLLTMALFAVLTCSFGQITTTKVQSAPVKIIGTPYDSTRNYQGDVPQNYIGQTLYLKGQPEQLREYGYDGFLLDYTKPKSYYVKNKKQDNVYKCCQSFNSIYDEMADKYFEVLDVIKHPEAEKKKELYGDVKYLKLKEKESGDVVYYTYKISDRKYWDVVEDETFPFIVVGFYEKAKKSYIGQEFLLSNRVLQSTEEITTGNSIVNAESVWKCVDLTIEEKYYKPAIIAENSTGEKVIVRLSDINGRFSKGKVYTMKEADAYKQKFGDEMFKKILQSRVDIGMTDEMCTLSWGEPKKINKTLTDGKTSEQWVYTNNNLYVENGIVTAIQVQEK